ncbi:uncharacterized protein LOC132745069 [Ruditapes philippinarum]|uniref:uncharacterized protein LOC132745069 n=1 Tax=Ruditapes philippinarum TaxID=129788 RepID=UPI00295B7822|nr:uncharacterized protein LOC132745069 [Ruditapes philippinarum]
MLQMASLSEQTNTFTCLNYVPGNGYFWTKQSFYSAEATYGRQKFNINKASPVYISPFFYPNSTFTHPNSTYYHPNSTYYNTNSAYNNTNTAYTHPTNENTSAKERTPSPIIQEETPEEKENREYIEYMKKNPYVEEEYVPDRLAFFMRLRDEIGDDIIDPDQSFVISAFDYH